MTAPLRSSDLDQRPFFDCNEGIVKITSTGLNWARSNHASAELGIHLSSLLQITNCVVRSGE
jgi:hypothetical protein